jgi:hypothetical protein
MLYLIIIGSIAVAVALLFVRWMAAGFVSEAKIQAVERGIDQAMRIGCLLTIAGFGSFIAYILLIWMPNHPSSP